MNNTGHKGRQDMPDTDSSPSFNVGKARTLASFDDGTTLSILTSAGSTARISVGKLPDPVTGLWDLVCVVNGVTSILATGTVIAMHRARNGVANMLLSHPAAIRRAPWNGRAATGIMGFVAGIAIGTMVVAGSMTASQGSGPAGPGPWAPVQPQGMTGDQAPVAPAPHGTTATMPRSGDMVRIPPSGPVSLDEGGSAGASPRGDQDAYGEIGGPDQGPGRSPEAHEAPGQGTRSQGNTPVAGAGAVPTGMPGTRNGRTASTSELRELVESLSQGKPINPSVVASLPADLAARVREAEKARLERESVTAMQPSMSMPSTMPGIGPSPYSTAPARRDENGILDVPGPGSWSAVQLPPVPMPGGSNMESSEEFRAFGLQP